MVATDIQQQESMIFNYLTKDQSVPTQDPQLYNQMLY